MVIMASGIARGRVRTTATTTTVKSRNMAAMLLQRNAPSVCSSSVPSFLCGIFKEKKTNDSGGWSNVLHWSYKTKKNHGKQELTAERSSEREPRASAGEGGETVLNINNDLNYSKSGARKRWWIIIEHCNAAKLRRAIERRRNTRQIDSEDCRLSQV